LRAEHIDAIEALGRNDAAVHAFLRVKRQGGLEWANVLAQMVLHLAQDKANLTTRLVDAERNRAATASASGAKCECCDGKGGWATSERRDPVSGPEYEVERCTDCDGTGRAPAPSRDAAPQIKTWRERMRERLAGDEADAQHVAEAMYAEIADLRATLAQQGAAQAPASEKGEGNE
jgi:hypothetical protein